MARGNPASLTARPNVVLDAPIVVNELRLCSDAPVRMALDLRKVVRWRPLMSCHPQLSVSPDLRSISYRLNFLAGTLLANK